jgi:hypothetical protein
MGRRASLNEWNTFEAPWWVPNTHIPDDSNMDAGDSGEAYELPS